MSEDGTLSRGERVAEREARVSPRSAAPSGGIFISEKIDEIGEAFGDTMDVQCLCQGGAYRSLRASAAVGIPRYRYDAYLLYSHSCYFPNKARVNRNIRFLPSSSRRFTEAGWCA